MSHIGTQGVALIDRALTAVEVVNTTDETTVYSYVIPAGLLGTSSGVRLTLQGSYLNDSGANRTLELRITFGGTTLWEDVTTNIGASANRRPASLTLLLMNLGATNSQSLTGLAQVIGAADTPTTGEGALDTAIANQSSSFGTPIKGVSSIDTTVAQTFAVVVQHSAAASTIRLIVQPVLLEFLP